MITKEPQMTSQGAPRLTLNNCGFAGRGESRVQRPPVGMSLDSVFWNTKQAKCSWREPSRSEHDETRAVMQAAQGDRPSPTARALGGLWGVGLPVLKLGESWAHWDWSVTLGKSQVIPGEGTMGRSVGWLSSLCDGRAWVCFKQANP